MAKEKLTVVESAESAESIVTSILQAEDKAREIRRAANYEAKNVVVEGEEKAAALREEVKTTAREERKQAIAEGEAEGRRRAEEIAAGGERECAALAASCKGKMQAATDAIMMGVTSGTWLS